LSRERAKSLIKKVYAQAAHINDAWRSNPFQIRTVAVSGHYMSRRDAIPELSLWVFLCRRPEARTRRWRPMQGKREGLRDILAAVNGLSSFVVARIVGDRQALPRQFSVVFEAQDPIAETDVTGWERVRDWTVSITRRLP